MFSRVSFGVGVLALLLSSSPSVALERFVGPLSGDLEVVPTGSGGSGTATLTLDGDTLSVGVLFSGLTGNVSAAPIHCCAGAGSSAGVAITLTGFPTGVTSGNYEHAFDLLDSAIYNSTFLTGSGGTAAAAMAALVAALRDDETYVNLHTTVFAGGEIRANPTSKIFLDGFDLEGGTYCYWSMHVGGPDCS